MATLEVSVGEPNPGTSIRGSILSLSIKVVSFSGGIPKCGRKSKRKKRLVLIRVCNRLRYGPYCQPLSGRTRKLSVWTAVHTQLTSLAFFTKLLLFTTNDFNSVILDDVLALTIISTLSWHLCKLGQSIFKPLELTDSWHVILCKTKPFWMFFSIYADIDVTF